MAKAKAAGALESKGVDILKDGDAEAKLRWSFMAGLMKARPAEAEAELKILPPGELASTLQHHACWGSRQGSGGRRRLLPAEGAGGAEVKRGLTHGK